MKTNGDKKQYAHPFSLTQEHIAKNTHTIHNRFNSATMFVSPNPGPGFSMCCLFHVQ